MKSAEFLVAEKLWEKVLVVLFGIIFLVGFLAATTIQKIVEFLNLKKQLEKYTKKWNLTEAGKDVAIFLMGVTIVVVSVAVSYKSITTTNQNDISNEKDNDKIRETQKNVCELLEQKCYDSILAEAFFSKPSESETENEKEKKKKRKKRKKGCEIFVRNLPVNHPIFIEFSDVIIPKQGVMRFLINEQFEVNCVQSTFSNGFKVSSKTIQCVGDDEYQIVGEPGPPVGVSAFNSCIKRIELTQVDGAFCNGGVMKHMGFQMPSVGFFELSKHHHSEIPFVV